MPKLTISPALMTAIYQGYNTKFQAGLGRGDIYWGEVAMTVPSGDAQEVYGWLGKTTGFRKWLGDRVIQSLEGHDFTIKNEHYENTVGVNRDQIEDDKYGLLGTIFEQMGQDTAEHPDTLIWDLLASGTTAVCYDGRPYFAANHPVTDSKGKVTNTSNLTTEAGGKPFWYVADLSRVLKPIIWQTRRNYDFVRVDSATDSMVFLKNEALYGVDARVNAGFGLWQMMQASNQDLTATTFKAVRTAMRNLKSDNGRPLNMKPTHIFVPPALESAAELLFKRTLIDGGSSNELAGAVKVVVVPYLA